MEAADLIGLAVPATYFIFLATEKIRPARTFPARKGWQSRRTNLLSSSVPMPVNLPTRLPISSPLGRSGVNSAGAHELLWRGTTVGQPTESDSMRCIQA